MNRSLATSVRLEISIDHNRTPVAVDRSGATASLSRAGFREDGRAAFRECVSQQNPHELIRRS